MQYIGGHSRPQTGNERLLSVTTKTSTLKRRPCVNIQPRVTINLS